MPEWPVGWWLAFEVGTRVWLALTVRPSPQPTGPLPSPGAAPSPAASSLALFEDAQ